MGYVFLVYVITPLLKYPFFGEKSLTDSKVSYVKAQLTARREQQHKHVLPHWNLGAFFPNKYVSWQSKGPDPLMPRLPPRNSRP